MNKKDMTAATKNGLRRQILDESAKLFIAHGFNGIANQLAEHKLELTRRRLNSLDNAKVAIAAVNPFSFRKVNATRKKRIGSAATKAER